MQRELLQRNRPTRATLSRAHSHCTFGLNIFYGTQAELNSHGHVALLAWHREDRERQRGSSGATQSATISLGTASRGRQRADSDVPAEERSGRRARSDRGSLDDDDQRNRLLDRARQDHHPARRERGEQLDARRCSTSARPKRSTRCRRTSRSATSARTSASRLTSYFTADGAGIGGASLSSFSLPGSGPFKYYGVPTAKQAAGDLHVAIAFALPNLQTTDQVALRGAVLQGSDGSHGDAGRGHDRTDRDRRGRDDTVRSAPRDGTDAGGVQQVRQRLVHSGRDGRGR